MAEAREAWQNGYAECRMRIVKEEKVDLSEYMDYTAGAIGQIGHFLNLAKTIQFKGFTSV